MAERGEIIRLLDDEGKTHEFSLVDVLEVEHKRYAILQPADEDEDAVLFRVEDDTLVTIDNDAEFDRVVEAIRASGDDDELAPAETEPEDEGDDGGEVT